MDDEHVSYYFVQSLKHICPIDMSSRRLHQCFKCLGRLLVPEEPWETHQHWSVLEGMQECTGQWQGSSVSVPPQADPLLTRLLHRQLYASGYLKWSSLWSILEPETHWDHLILKSYVISWVCSSTRKIWLIYNEISPSNAWACTDIFTCGIWGKYKKIMKLQLALIIYFAYSLWSLFFKWP